MRQIDADLRWKVDLKFLNSGIIMKSFIHVSDYVRTTDTRYLLDRVTHPCNTVACQNNSITDF